MKTIFRNITIIILVFFTSCVNSHKKNNDNTLHTFFTNTKWNDFNSKTLLENKLDHFIDDKIDFYNRESFFSYMKKYELNNPYNNFYLIEIESPNGERAISKKIIVINYNDKLTYLGFKKANSWNKITLTKEEINQYKYKDLKNGIKKNDGDYILITQIKQSKY